MSFGPAERANALALIDLALAEDLGDRGDVTTDATVPIDARASALVVSRALGTVAGLPIVPLVLERARSQVEWSPLIDDGAKVAPGTSLGRLSGPARPLLTLERTILNFLTRLSGVATLTARFVAEASETKAKVLDTRKTAPGWRALEKYAVRQGGGSNHRNGLYDQILIKDNHLAWIGAGPSSIALAIERARSLAPGLIVEVEVDDLDGLDRALAALADIVLVDNFGPEGLAEAVRRRDLLAPGVLLEVSGGVTLGTVRALALAGADRISVGALTHSAPALDLGLDDDQGPA